MRILRIVIMVLLANGFAPANAQKLKSISKIESTPAIQYGGALYFLESELARDGIDIKTAKESTLTPKQADIVHQCRMMLALQEEKFWKYGLEDRQFLSEKELVVWKDLDRLRDRKQSNLSDLDFLRNRLQYVQYEALLEAAKRSQFEKQYRLKYPSSSSRPAEREKSDKAIDQNTLVQDTELKS